MRHLPSRHPRGTPAGGRFAPAGHTETDLTLQPALDLGLDRRLDTLLAADGPATWHPGNPTGPEAAHDDTEARWIYRGCGHVVVATARALASTGHCGDCNPPDYRHPWLDMDTDPAACLAALRPDLAACLDPARNGGWTADRVPADYRGTVVWTQPGCGHTWRGKVKGRSDDACWVCEGRTLVPGVNDLHTLHPDLAAQAPARLNGGLHPVEIRPREQLRRLTWTDPTCGHTWRETPYRRVVEGRGCPDCAAASPLPATGPAA